MTDQIDSQSLPGSILAVLQSASRPLLAREIAERLTRRLGRQVDKKSVNHWLYSSELNSRVQQDPSYKWVLRGEHPTHGPPSKSEETGESEILGPIDGPDRERDTEWRVRPEYLGTFTDKKDVASRDLLGCPWLASYSKAAYAAGAVVQVLGGAEMYSSPWLKKLYQLRSGFTLKPPNPSPIPAPTRENHRLLGALLCKIAQRGVPAPCSLKVERHVLTAAAEAGILDYTEETRSGQYEFVVEEFLESLEELLKLAFLPELLLEGLEVERLTKQHLRLCSSLETHFTTQLASRLTDPRLLLFALPQRPFETMLSGAAAAPFYGSERIDFAVELPAFAAGGRDLKLAIELDDPRHGEIAQETLDARRDQALKESGWEVVRVESDRAVEIEEALLRVTREIEEALPPRLREAAQEFRTMEAQKKRALLNLVRLPLAEAHLTAALGVILHRGFEGDFLIADPQDLELNPVLEAIGETVTHLAQLHNLPVPQLPELADSTTSGSDEPPTLIYWSTPSEGVWSGLRTKGAIHIVSRPTSPDYVEPLLPASPRPVKPDTDEHLETIRACLLYILRNVFRKLDFRDGQIPIIERMLTLSPVIGLLPTAAGKSLCYQLASLLEPGITIVVDPLRSLMLDQQENLRVMGIERAQAIMSGFGESNLDDRIHKETSYRRIELGHEIFVFVAPERLQMPDFREHVKSFAANVPVTYAVVDEAHCVSEWGHDFRPSYLNVGRILRQHCLHDGSQPSLVALTGTASRNVIIDMMRELEIEDQDSVVEPGSFDRKELGFEVYRVPPEDRIAFLAGKVRNVLVEFGWRPGQSGPLPSGLIFTYFVNDVTIGVGLLTEELRSRLGLPFEPYAATPIFGFGGTKLSWDRANIETQLRFKRDEAPLLVCTHAFGMGIDKPNIRFTIHAMLPRSLEEFYQHAGRAGRDGRQSRCLIIYSDDQQGMADEVLDTERTSLEEIALKASSIPRKSQGDAIRNTWFLTNSFLGRQREKALFKYVFEEIVLPSIPVHSGDSVLVDVSFLAVPVKELVQEGGKPAGKISREDRETALEKALYRLLLIGGIDDYMKDYSRKKFHVRVRAKDSQDVRQALETYLRRYATEGETRKYLSEVGSLHSFREAVVRSGEALIDYIYDTVEKRRRRAIGQMLEVAREASSLGPDRFREQLLAYLEESEFSGPVAALVERIEPADWLQVLQKVDGRDGITKLLGACRRQLEEFPSHPGLLILSGFCRAGSPVSSSGIGDIESGFTVLQREIADRDTRAVLAQELAKHAYRLFPSRGDEIMMTILRIDPTLEMARACYRDFPSALPARHLAVRILVSDLVESLRSWRAA